MNLFAILPIGVSFSVLYAHVLSEHAMMSWQDPLQAKVPAIRDGYMGAVYYGQRRSGDFYDFIRSSPHRVLFGLFDAAGELQQTRPIVIALQQNFRNLGSQLLASEGANESEAILELWIEMNRALMKAAGGVHSCPAFLGCYNDDLGTMCYVNSGHTPGLMRDGQEVRDLNATALPLGLFSHSVPECSVVAMGPGQAFLLVSKGIVEARHRGEEYGLDRVRGYLQETRFESAHETCVGVLSRVQQFMRTAPTHNDVTALALIRSI